MLGTSHLVLITVSIYNVIYTYIVWTGQYGKTQSNLQESYAPKQDLHQYYG